MKQALLDALEARYEADVSAAHAIIKVPNYNSINRRVRGNKWCGFRFPDHVNQFTPKTLLTMVSNANYEVVKFNFFDYLPTSDNMWMVIKPKQDL